MFHRSFKGTRWLRMLNPLGNTRKRKVFMPEVSDSDSVFSHATLLSIFSLIKFSQKKKKIMVRAVVERFCNKDFLLFVSI